MVRAAIRAVLSGCAIGMAGCGTVVNVGGPAPSPYGGVVIDGAVGVSTFPSVLSVACLADIPISLVGDTLTLPWTIWGKPAMQTSDWRPDAAPPAASPSQAESSGGPIVTLDPPVVLRPIETAGGELQAMPWPVDWSGYLGKKVVVEGAAANAKLGAVLTGKDGQVWIDGLESWPDNIATLSDKRVRVSGFVIQRDDLPAFVQRPGAPPRSGVVAKSEQHTSKAKTRFLLTQATWAVVD